MAKYTGVQFFRGHSVLPTTLLSWSAITTCWHPATIYSIQRQRHKFHTVGYKSWTREQSKRKNFVPPNSYKLWVQNAV